MIIPEKEVFSPFDLSHICQTDLARVQEWIDNKEVRTFQVGGMHDRIRRKDLLEFLSQKRINVPDHWTGTPGKFRVLLVEDELDLLELIGEMLNDDPRLDVQTESSGFGAALKIAKWHPDVILLDFVMPGMNGFEVCRKLKSDPQTRDIPIIAITSLSSPENRELVMQAGITSFVGKPFQSDKLLDKVRELLGLAEAAQ